MDKEHILQTVLACGATKATIIPQSQIVMSAHYRDICASNQCGGYGRCWMCPPDIGEIDELMEKVRSSSCGVLYQSISQIEDSFDIEGMFEAGHTHAMLSQRIHKAVKPILGENFLHLSCGGCHLCETCAKTTGEPCRQPENALAGLEGYGVDVYKTTMGTDLKYINGADTVTYFGIVLLSE